MMIGPFTIREIRTRLSRFRDAADAIDRVPPADTAARRAAEHDYADALKSIEWMALFAQMEESSQAARAVRVRAMFVELAASLATDPGIAPDSKGGQSAQHTNETEVSSGSPERRLEGAGGPARGARLALVSGGKGAGRA